MRHGRAGCRGFRVNTECKCAPSEGICSPPTAKGDTMTQVDFNRLRRRLVTGGAAAIAGAGLGTFARSALAQAATIELPIVNGARRLVAFPEKRPLIVLTSRPPQLETPFEVFNEGLITPNDAFFVRYHN